MNLRCPPALPVPDPGTAPGTGAGQRRLRPALGRPMGDVNAAMRDLDANAEQVRALLDEGKLVGFNIGARDGGRATVRVLTRSIEHYLETGAPLPLAWEQIFRLLIPHDKLFLRGPEIQRALNCDRGLVENLIRAKRFACVKQTRPGQGRFAHGHPRELPHIYERPDVVKNSHQLTRLSQLEGF